jgi:hypothetical protein
MKIATILITLLLIGGFISGIGGFYTGLMASYPGADNSTPLSSATMNMTNRTQEAFSDMTGTLNQNKSASSGSVTSDAPTNLITNAFVAGNMILKTPALFSALITDITGIAGVPTWVSVMIWGIISVIIVFAVIEFITGRQTQE